jgi:hypothetical protein
MNSADIIRALLHGDRDPVEDADDITINDGLQSVELHHRSPDGESAVVLTYGEYAQYRRDPDTSTHEFDIYNVDVGEPTENPTSE